MSRRGQRLDNLTRRWRERHDARLASQTDRPRANPGREALARKNFPYRDKTPAEYVDEHGAAMTGFTYDEESYVDAKLDAWLVEVGRILRERRARSETRSASGGAKAAAMAETEAGADPEPSADAADPPGANDIGGEDA